MTNSVTNIKQRLQTRPIKGFSVSEKVNASGVSSLDALPPPLRQRYVAAINAAMRQAFGIEPIEIFWNERAKQAILAHQTFLDVLSKDFGQAVESLPIEVQVVLDERTNILYFLADKATGSGVKREGTLVVGNEAGAGPSEIKVQTPPVGTVVKNQSLAEAYEKAGQWGKAAEVYEKAGQWGKAAECYERALQGMRAASLSVSVPWTEKAASLYEKAGQWRKAAEVYEKAGQWGKAAKVYEEAEQWGMVARCHKMMAKCHKIMITARRPKMTAKERQDLENSYEIAEKARTRSEAEAKARYERIRRAAGEKHRKEQAAESAEIERRAAARDAARVREREEAKADEAAEKNKKWWQ
jgi:tetratricopeptide (TPR) repeat protein